MLTLNFARIPFCFPGQGYPLCNMPDPWKPPVTLPLIGTGGVDIFKVSKGPFLCRPGVQSQMDIRTCWLWSIETDVN